MAQNYNLNSKFGFNITTGKKNPETAKQTAVNIQESDKGIFDAITNYVKKYEDVFNGNIEKEINLYERQAMIVGMNLRAGEVKRKFDVSI